MSDIVTELHDAINGAHRSVRDDHELMRRAAKCIGEYREGLFKAEEAGDLQQVLANYRSIRRLVLSEQYVCSDCPPETYTTNATRCAPCPRRST